MYSLRCTATCSAHRAEVADSDREPGVRTGKFRARRKRSRRQRNGSSARSRENRPPMTSPYYWDWDNVPLGLQPRRLSLKEKTRIAIARASNFTCPCHCHSLIVWFLTSAAGRKEVWSWNKLALGPYIRMKKTTELLLWKKGDLDHLHIGEFTCKLIYM